MFPASAKYDLRRVGLWMFVAGTLFAVAGTVMSAVAISEALQSGQNIDARGEALWTVLRALAEPLIVNSFIFYTVGRLVQSWRVSLIGFEGKTGELLVRRPDGSPTVWIGRRYRSLSEAEAAAAALKDRLKGVTP